MRRIQLFLLTFMSCFALTAQTVTVISPTGDGGFETGTTLAANGWNYVGHATINAWYVGGVAVSAGSRGCYVGQSVSNNNGGNGAPTTNHIYRDVTIPAGATNVQLSFKLRYTTSEPLWDRFCVAIYPTSVVPTTGSYGTAYPYTGIVGSASLPGATAMLYENSNVYSSFVVVNSSTPAGTYSSAGTLLNLTAYAGTTFRLAFTFTNADQWGTAGNPAIDEISLTYTAPSPAAPVTPSTLAFGGVLTGSSSPAQTFTVSGSYLSPASGNLTVTAPANYQVSSNGSTWVSSYNIPYTSATLAATPVYVRFNPTAAIAYSGNVTVTGGGLASASNVSVNGSGAAACSGTPTAGSAGASPTVANSTTLISLSLSGYSSAAGLTYQWQTSPDGSTGWTNIGGATNLTYSTTGISSNTYYRCVVSCGAASANSSPALVTFLPPTPACIPTSSSWSSAGSTSYGLNGFSITGYSGSTLSDVGIVSATSTANGYLNRTSLTPVNLQQNGVYASSGTWGTVSGYQYLCVWIDFNNNGTFEASEAVSPVSGSIGTPPQPTTFNISIPASAAPGLHLMRVRGIWESIATTLGVMPSAVHPCNLNNGSNPSYYSGTITDYYVNIVPLPACSGTPSTGVVNASALSNCTTFSSNLSLSLGATGQTYQWQSSTNDITFTNISGATNPTYTATVSANTYYRCVVTCTSSGLSATSPSRLLQILPCILMPSSGSGSSTVCGGLFYDNGGPSGNYACCSITGTYTFYPGTPGKKVQLVFNSFANETCCDYMRFYNGNSTGAPMIGGSYYSNPGTITSTAADGSLTVTFYSDISSVAAGWEAVINLVGTASNPITTQPIATSSACLLGSVAPLSVAATGSTFTYQWYNNGTTNSNTGGTLIPAATNSTYAPSTASVGNTYYYCVVRDACGNTTASNTAQVIVSPPPPAITGLNEVCQTRTITLNNPVTVGTWSSSNTSVATVTGASGIATVTGGAAGNAVISYFTSPACFVTQAITVNATPVPMTGTLLVCEAGTTALTHPDGGTGTWSSTNPAAATIGLTSGIATGIASGFTTISYTNTKGCVTSRELTVNPLPVVTVSPSADTVCPGNSAVFTVTSPTPQMNLLSQDFNTSLGAWTVTNGGGVPAANGWSLVPSPGDVGVLGDGTPFLQANSQTYFPNTVTTLTSPSFSTTGGFGAITLTFNQTLLSFSPDLSAAVEYSINNGPWQPLAEQITSSPAIINDGGTWSASNPQFNMDLPAAAIGQPDVRLRWIYNAQSLYWTIDNISVKGTMPASSFAWSGVAGLSCTNCATTTISPLSMGANLYNVATTTSAGCIRNTPVVVSVETPSAVTGAATVCQDATTIFSNATPYGSWSSANTAIATVDAASGEVYGVSAGLTTITYALPSGCYSIKNIQVIAAPVASGPSAVCQGSPAIFSGSTPGAVWSSSAPAIATINSSGIVTTNTLVSGALNIYYTSPSTGCIRTLPFTVNAVPAITGTAAACEGATSTLSASVSGGTWTSANSLVASVDPITGVVTGVNALNTMISYTTPAGCVGRRNFVVNQLPFAINGSNTVCESSATALSDATPGGIWTSSNTSVVTINSLGEVTPMTSAGNATITYTVLTTGCYRTTTMTVNPLPSLIAGGTTVCAGNGTTLLSSFPGGGTWASSNPVLASIDVTTGLLTGRISGAVTVTYTLPTGCLRTQPIVINPQPNSITGTATICEGFTSDLNNSTPGGTWSTADAGIASVDPVTGLVTGNVAGNVEVSYTLGSGCSRVRTVTVNTTPAAFTGVLNTCPGQSSMLSSFPAGGGWTSSVSSVATVSALGNVTGVAQGNVNISYTLPNGCRRVENFVVNPLPAVITGTRKVCIGEATQLFSTTTGGTWATTSTNADIDLTSGIITGNTAGTLPVTYTLPTGCFRATTVTVNALPEAIAGPSVVCEGSTITLTNPSNGGTWNTANASIATIGATSGMLTGVADGIVNVSYTLPTGCRSTMAVQVNGRPGVIAGLSVICKDQQTTLTSTPGGVWSSSDLGVVSVDATGIMTGMGAGNAEVRYTLPTGCFRSHMVTVNPLPAAIVGNISLCQGGATGLYSATPGGTWSSSNPAVAPISPVGLVLGNGVGFSIISYTLPTGCARTATMVVNGLPEPITGVAVVCAGKTTQLESTTPGGIWSTNNDVVSISNTGLALGVGAGTSIVSYTNNLGCRRTMVVTVNGLPDLITGSATICPGTTATLGNSVAGGTWASDNTAMLTIGATSGMITAVGADGTANVTYTLPTGCIRATQIIVHPAVAPVTGTTTICREGTTTLSNATVGGTWMSGNTTIATVDETTGMVTGVGAGVTSIAYVMPTGCKSVATLIVNALPANITGAASVCAGATAMLENAVPGGSWSVANTAIATVNAAGMITGVAAGETQVVYTLPTGCAASRGMVVNALPVVQDVTGGGGYCAGGAGVAVGIDTTENNMLYKLMDGTGTVLTMVGNGGTLSFGNQTAAGTYSVTAVSLQGCMQAMNGTATVVVNPILTPTVNVLSDKGSSVCAGTTVTYSVSSANAGATPGYVWKVNGTEVGTAATYSYIPANGDEVSVKLTSSEACAVPAQVSAVMTMEVLPVLTPSVSIVVGPDDTLCQGGMATFHATVANGGTSPVYTWQVNGAIVAGATNDIYTYEPSNNDVVVCRLTSSYACVSANDVASNAITMHVDEIYTPIVEMTANPGIAVNAGTPVTFTANPIKAGTAPLFQWIVNDKVIADATQNTYTTSNLSDRDSVTCIVTATDKCSNRSINSIVMTVLTSATQAGSVKLGNSELRLMPNPNAGSFVVTGTLGVKTDEVVMFEVTNMLGQVIYRGSSKAQGGVVEARIDLGNDLANGMYLLNVTAGGDQRSFHFVLKH